MLKLMFTNLLILALLSFSNCQDSALPEEEQDICIGRSYDIECKPTQNTDFTVVITEAVYGTHKVPSAVCAFNNSDCFEPSEDEYCFYPDETCTIYSYDTRLENCENKLADYLHVRHRCIPESSKAITNYNICDKTITQITDSKGFLSSPNYPKYEIVENECVQKIVAPSNKVINLWFASVDIESENEYDECEENYIKITDTTGTYTVCGYRKYSLQNRLCSSVIYVSYIAIEDLNPEYYRGFRIYYEFVDRSTQPSCPTATAGVPTTPIRTTRPMQLIDLQASSFQRLYVCKGDAKTIRVPNGYTLHIINAYYGVTNDQTCETINPDNCKSLYTLLCASQSSCTVSLLSDYPLFQCGNRLANYIELQYRYLPVISSQNSSICDSGDIILKNSSYSIITNPNYPSWTPNSNCKRKLIAPTGHFIRTYLTDLNIEPADEQDGQCKQGYIQLESECESKKHCGRKTSNGLYEFTSCSNFLVVSYVSTTSIYDLRGFNMYLEVVRDLSDSPSAEYQQSICAGDDGYLECTSSQSSNYTVVVSEAFYGISATNKSSCEYKEGDCVDAAPTEDFCYYAEETCEPYAYSYEQLSSCGNQYAGYLHLRYNCVPFESALIPEYNICDKTIKEITIPKGFISSPGYPEYQMVPNVCTQKLVAPSSKSINIWIVNMDMYEDWLDGCEEDFLSVTDVTGTYSYCGWQKVSLANKLCSSVVYVSYLAREDLTEWLYSGFRIYYEFVDRKPELNCPTGTPGTPTPPVYTTTTRPLIADLSATFVETLFVCLSEEKKIEIPSGYVLFPIGMYYGVTENGSCSNISPQDCKTPTTLNCPLEGTCSINFNVNHLMPSCGNKYATYIEFKYRFIPLTSSKNRTICSDTTVDGSIYPYGIITNPNYPHWEPNKDCSIQIDAPVGKIIRVSVTDLSIEPADNTGKCSTGFLEIKSDCEDVSYCGNRGSNSHIVTSCSNKLTIRYKSTTSSLLLRGFNVFFEITQQDVAGIENRTDFCVTQSSSNLDCPTSYTTNFTNVVTTAFYGAPRSGTSCQYNEGDCYVESTYNYCWSPYESCYVPIDDDIEIPSCGNKLAQYLHLRYKCIPAFSITIPDHNICDSKLQEVTIDKGFISSPNYPVYTMVPNQCMKKIVAPSNKIINMWIMTDMKNTDASDTCSNDYVRITDSTGTYTTCGWRKYSLEKKLCSSVVYVTYKAPADLFVSSYRGARIYYEFVDRSTLPGCPTNTPAPPTQPPIAPFTLGPPIITPLTASTIYKQYICRGSETTIQVPTRYQLFPIHVYYGVTPDQTCKTINPQNCKTPTSIDCKLDENCKISFPIGVPVSDCSGRMADYIGIEYRFIPLYTAGNYTVCDNTEIDGTKVKHGVMTQPNYPNWEPSKNCIRRIVAPPNAYVRVYISDISIELPQENNQQCQRGYLGLDSGCQNIKYCGQKSKTGSYVFTSCSNILTISYVSSGTQNLGYRGFNLYFEIIYPEIASIQQTKDLCPGTSVDITADSNISTNFTVVITDAILGVKKKTTTPSTSGTTTAPICKYESGDCTRSATSSYCNSPSQSCSIYNFYYEYIANCNDEKADYLHLRYKYVPVSSGTINSYNICDRNLKDITETSAFIDSPNYPTYTQVMDECTQKIVAPNDKVIKIWFPHVQIRESEPNNDCKNDYIRIVDSVSTYKICGERKYSFENNLCASQIFITYKAASLSSSYQGFRLYYEFADRSTQPNCPTIIPTLPTLPGVITPPTQVTEIVASPLYQEYVCKGKEKVIEVPATSFFFKIKAYYGYTSDPNCQAFNPTDCNSPAPITCISGQKCTISLYNEIEIDSCNGQKANYIGLEYRFIPLYTSKNYSICDAKPIDGSITNAGVITNVDYPNIQYSNVNCARNVTIPEGYVFRAYITDISMEPKQGLECIRNYLGFDSDTVSSKYCGEVSGSERDIYESCSKVVTISYKSTTSNRLRGFNMYFEIIQKDSIICPTKPVVTKPTTGYVTLMNDDKKTSGSGALIGWTLGIGIPLVIVIIVGVWWFIKKSKTQNINKESREDFTFSKLSASPYDNA